MKLYYSILLSLLFIISKYSLGQDTLFLKNNNKEIVKIFEINSTEIKYKRFNYLEGPVFSINKTDVALIVYQNGTREDTFTQTVSETMADKPEFVIKVIDGEKEEKLNDYVKFNIQFGAMICNSFCNVPRNLNYNVDKFNITKYSGNQKKYQSTFNFGFNFIFGNNTYLKKILSINYLRTKGEFAYEFLNDSRFRYSYYKYQYNSIVDFINLTTGLRITLNKKLFIEPLLSMNLLVNSSVKAYGYEEYTDLSAHTSQTIYYEYGYAKDRKISSTVSFCPRIIYQFKIENKTFEIYGAYNIAITYRLPWWMFGITYYPFKKLR